VFIFSVHLFISCWQLKFVTMTAHFRILLTACIIVQLVAGFSRSPVSLNTRSNKYHGSATFLRETASADAGSNGGIATLVDFASKVTGSTFYSGIETVIVLGLLSAIDGGFSGDWSRLGLISTDMEATLRSAVTSVGLFHLVCAPIAAASAAKNQQPLVPAVLHTLLIGGLGLGKVLFQRESTLIQFPNVKQGFADAVAGKYDEVAVNQYIDNVIDENAVVMFSFSTCPYCIKAKQLLIDELGVNVKGKSFRNVILQHVCNHCL
jgi:Glutaredoxin